MKLWRTIRRELAAAARSVHYDLGRATPPAGRSRRAPATGVLPAVTDEAAEAGAEAGADDGAETGAGGAYDAYARRRRPRVRSAAAVAVLAVGAAAATYFGVVGGLSALLVDEAGAPSRLPWTATQPAAPAASPDAPRPRASAPDDAPAIVALPPAAPPPAAAPDRAAPEAADRPPASAPLRPAPPTGREESTTRPPCECARPTVDPTDPTDPPGPTASPSPSPSAEPTATPCEEAHRWPKASPRPCEDATTSPQP